jgi:hypothetical protein
MPNWVREFLDYIAAEGRVILGAPVAFFAFVLLAALGALSWKFDSQITSRDSIIAARDSVIGARDATIKFQDALIAEYKNRQQIPTETGEDRRLAPEQKRILAKEIRAKMDKVPKIVIYTASERESRQYAKQFADLIQGIGIDVIQREVPSSSTTEVGLFVGIRQPEKPSDEAQEFLEILHKANIAAHFTPWLTPQTLTKKMRILICMSQSHFGELSPFGSRESLEDGPRCGPFLLLNPATKSNSSLS